MYDENNGMDLYDDYNTYNDYEPPYQPYKRKEKKKKPKLWWLVVCVVVIIGLSNQIFKKEKEQPINENQPVVNNPTEEEVTLNNQVSDMQTDQLSYYFYSQLNTKEQETYNAILNGMLNMDAKVCIKETDKNEMEKIVMGIMADHPELFWCDGSYTYITYDTYVEFSPTYLYDKQQKSSRQKEIDNQVESILNGIQSNWSEYEKIKYVFEAVIERVEYVTGAPDNQNIYGSLVNKRSVCAGYTRACQYLLQQQGIECLYITGMVNGTESHAWNIVKCNGNYYHVDATFGERAFDNDTQSNMPDELGINYAYLCCSDREIYTNHYSDMIYQLPICNILDLNYFKMQGSYYEYYSDLVLQELKHAIFNGDKVWQCQFSNQQAYQMMLSAIEDGAFTDIVGAYQTSVGYNGSWMTWHTGDDAMYTISCWY